MNRFVSPLRRVGNGYQDDYDSIEERAASRAFDQCSVGRDLMHGSTITRFVCFAQARNPKRVHTEDTVEESKRQEMRNIATEDTESTEISKGI